MTRTTVVRARSVLLGLALAVAGAAQAQEPAGPASAATAPRPGPPVLAKAGPLALESSAIRGNQELPKVLYIVPWKDPAMAELAGRPVNSLVEEILSPVDREVFRRQTRYFGQLYAVGSAQSESAVPDGLRDASGGGRQNGQ